MPDDKKQKPRKYIELCGLWEYESSKGKYMAGTLRAGLRVYVVPNKKRRSNKEPAFHVLLSQELPTEIAKATMGATP